MKKILKMFKEKITLRLLSMILGVILIIGGAAVILILQQMRNQEVTNATLLGETALGSVNNALNTWISDQINLISMISTDENVINACLDPQDATKRENAFLFVDRFYKSYGYYENIPVASRFQENEPFQIMVNDNPVDIVSGAFFVDTVGDSTLGKGSDKSYITASFSGIKDYISVVYPSILRGNPIFVISEPVYSGEVVVGAALIAPQMDYFTDIFVQDQKIGKTGYMIFFDDRGMLIAYPDKTQILNQDSIEIFSPITSRIIAGEESFFAMDANGEKRFFIGEKISLPTDNIENEWYMVVSIAESEVYEGSRSFSVKIYFAAIILFIVLILLVYLIINRMLVKPLKKMVNVAERIAVGEINQVVESKQEDEVGSLAKTFQKMIIYFQKMANLTNHLAEFDLREKIEPFSDEDVLGVSFRRMAKNLREMITQMSENAFMLDESSSRLSTTAQLAGSTTNQIASTMHEVAKGIGQQTDSVEKTAEIVDQMDKTIAGVAKGCSGTG